MNKQEWMDDLIALQTNHKKITGAIEYVIGKIQDLERLEKKEEEK